MESEASVGQEPIRQKKSPLPEVKEAIDVGAQKIADIAQWVRQSDQPAREGLEEIAEEPTRAVFDEVPGIDVPEDEQITPPSGVKRLRIDLLRRAIGVLFKRESKEKEPQRLDMEVIGEINILKEILESKGDLEDTCIILGGGGQAGVVQAGSMVGLFKKGIIEKTKTLLGVSSGACGVWYTAGGEPEKGANVYFKENVEGGFIKQFKRLLPKLDFDFLEDVIRNRKPIDIDRFQRSSHEVIVGVLNTETGETEFINLKNVKDPIKTVLASSTVPAVSVIDGELTSGISVEREDGTMFLGLDGSYGDQLPVRYAFEVLGVGRVIVLLNRPFFRKEGQLGQFQQLLKNQLQARVRPATINHVVKQKILDYNKNYEAGVDYINDVITAGDPDKRVVVFAPRNGKVVGNMTMDGPRLEAAYNEARDSAEELVDRLSQAA